MKAQANKSTRDRTLIKLLKSPGLMVSASGVSKTIFQPSDPNELCNRLKLLLQEKQAGNKSDLINQEIVAMVDKLLEYKCISEKQHNQILIKCNLLQKQVSIINKYSNANKDIIILMLVQICERLLYNCM